MTGLADVKLHLVDSLDDALEFKRWLGQARPVLAIDTETEGFKWWEHRVRLIQFGDANDGWAIPWQLWAGVAEEALRSYTGKIVCHHLKFDQRMIEHWSAIDGFPITLDPRQLDDTMLMAHVLDSSGPVALKPLAALHVDAKAARSQQVLHDAMAEQKWTWQTVPVRFEPYWLYGALDTVLTARLWEVLNPLVQADCPEAYSLELAVNQVVRRIEDRGCQVDLPYTQARLNEFEAYVEQSGCWCEEIYGVRPGSDTAIIRRLQADGCELTKLTASGARLALDKEVLEPLDHPLAQTILQRRRVQKLSSSYLSNFIGMAVDGVLHPSYNQVKEDQDDTHFGARTGRVQISEPGLQTLPRKNEENPLAITVRNCITAREGHTLVMADWDQIEARSLTHFTQDPGLMAAFGEGDFFTNMARELYADPTLVKADPRRQPMKNGFYALGYGAGPEKIALTTRQPLEAVQQFLDALAQRYPGIKRFQNEVANAAYTRQRNEGIAYVRSPLTNRRHVAKPKKEYALVNYLIQGLCAEIMKLKLVELDSAGVGQHLTLLVHDEFIADVPTDDVDEVHRIMGSVMNDNSLLSVPLTASVTTATRWGEAVK